MPIKSTAGLYVFLLIIGVGDCLAFTESGGFNPFVMTGAPTARSLAMGSVGYALSDDETALMHNPAGLGLRSERFNGGVASFTNNGFFEFEPWHQYSIAYQNEKLERLGVGGSFERMTSGMTKQIVSPDGQIISDEKLTFYNLKYTLAAGYRVYSNEVFDNAIGVSFDNYLNYQDPPSQSDQSTFTGNIGYILQLNKKWRMGLSLKNIDLSSSDSYKKVEGLCTGIGYKDFFTGNESRVLALAGEISYVHWFRGEVSDNVIQTGCEATLYKTVSFRAGYFSFPFNAITFGEGLSLFNHFDIDFHHMINLTNENSNSFGFSLSIKRILKWKKTDKQWWRKTDGSEAP